MAHKKGHKETWWERFKKGLKENRQARAAQFQGYLSHIDSLESKKFYSRRGRVENPGTDLNFKSGRVNTANTTKMSTILDRYHDRALRLAQAKYYQKQVG